MSDLFDRVTLDQDFIKKLFAKIPGFKGYIEREDRRSADKLLREFVANKFEEQYQRISGLQKDLISSGGLAFVDDVESAAIKLRQFIDRLRTAAYGYAGIFDAVKINENELAQVYQYDAALVALGDELARGVDNLEASLGNSEALPAAIRNVVSLAQRSVDAFDKRSEVMIGGIGGASQ